MTTQQFISRDFHGARIRQRSDGYFDATIMCKANNKRWFDYYRSKNTQDFLVVLSKSTGLPVEYQSGNMRSGENKGLVEITRGGINPGTWVHSKVAIHLAIWCNPEFAVLVINWVYELLTEGSVSLDPAQAKQKEIAACARVESDLLESFGITGNAKQIALNNILKEKFGYDALKIWGLESPVPEAPKVLLIPTDIAKRVGLKNAKLINLKLIELGLQTKHRDKRLYYKLTEAGLKHAQYQDTGKPQKSGELARAIRWYESVLTLF